MRGFRFPVNGHLVVHLCTWPRDGRAVAPPAVDIRPFRLHGVFHVDVAAIIDPIIGPQRVRQNRQSPADASAVMRSRSVACQPPPSPARSFSERLPVFWAVPCRKPYRSQLAGCCFPSSLPREACNESDPEGLSALRFRTKLRWHSATSVRRLSLRTPIPSRHSGSSCQNRSALRTARILAVACRSSTFTSAWTFSPQADDQAALLFPLPRGSIGPAPRTPVLVLPVETSFPFQAGRCIRKIHLPLERASRLPYRPPCRMGMKSNPPLKESCWPAPGPVGAGHFRLEIRTGRVTHGGVNAAQTLLLLVFSLAVAGHTPGAGMSLSHQCPWTPVE